MLFLLALLILGIVWVASALIDNDAASMESLYGMFLKCSRSFVIINPLFAFLQWTSFRINHSYSIFTMNLRPQDG